VLLRCSFSSLTAFSQRRLLAADWSGDHRRALRRAVTEGALATLVPGAVCCAPVDDAIEDVLGD
jgi:ribokinase